MELEASSFNKTELFNEIAARAEHDDPYRGTAFEAFHHMSSRAKGAAFEKLASIVLESLGKTVKRAIDSDYDRIVDGSRVEIKGSFLWAGTSSFKWQQIRPNQKYDYIVFVAVYPECVKFYASTKADCDIFVTQQDSSGNYIYNQHGGISTNSGTFAIMGEPEDFPFMKPLDQFVEGLDQ